MNEIPIPKIPQKKPYQEKLEPGKYFYCTCGKSSDQPFCDGSHKGTLFTPKKFFIENPTLTYLCGCKHTKNAPYCDGSHKRV